MRILSVGWSDFATREFISSHRAKRWEDVPRAIEQQWGKMRAGFGLQRFLQMNVDDRVVVPSWGTFHVFDVVSDERLIAGDLPLGGLETWDGHGVRMGEDKLYEYRDGKRQQDIDLGFFRRVRPVAKDIPRSGYADNALVSRLKVRQTNVEISDIGESVEQALARWKNEEPISLAGEVTKKCADEVLNLVIKELDPDRLEKLIGCYFKRIGASTARSPVQTSKYSLRQASIR